MLRDRPDLLKFRGGSVAEHGDHGLGARGHGTLPLPGQSSKVLISGGEAR